MIEYATMPLKKTSLYQRHLQNKGRMIEFNGWSLPLEYQSSLKEAKAVRTCCGLFDVSHMGEIVVKGKSFFDCLQRLVSNDLGLITPGQMQYNLFINPGGGIIDDCMIYRRPESFLCVVNATNKDKVLSWLKENRKSAEIADVSDSTALLSLQGPNSPLIMAEVFDQEIEKLRYLFFAEYNLGGKEVLVSRSGYTGEDGFEIYTGWDDAGYFWDKLREAGREFEITPCGLGARDILRIEAGYPLYGQEIDDTINPLEAGLSWAVKLNKDFIGQKQILKVKKEGLKRKRVGFLMQDKGVPRWGYDLYCQNKRIGKVCSGTYSPNRDKFIGMAYVERAFALEGREIEVEIRGKLYRAKIAKFPFVKPKTLKR